MEDQRQPIDLVQTRHVHDFGKLGCALSVDDLDYGIVHDDSLSTRDGRIGCYGRL